MSQAAWVVTCSVGHVTSRGTSAPACNLLSPASPWVPDSHPSHRAASLGVPSITQSPATGCSW